MTAALTLDTRVAAAHGLLASELAGETVLLNPADGVYYGLDTVGAHLWKRLAAPCPIDALVDDVVAHFDVDRARCAPDVLAFLEDLAAHGLIAVVAPGSR